MARLLALCSLPRTNPKNQHEFKRVNGPYTLYMVAGGGNKLPYGTLPRLLLAWVCTEAVRTQSPELILGDSLSEFMRKVGIYSTSGDKHTRLRNQMRGLWQGEICPREVITLAEQRFPELAGERVSEAVAVVESGRVSPLPKVGERPPRDLGLGEIDRHHLDAGGFEQQIEQPHTVCPLARLKDNRGFEEGGRRCPAHSRRRDRLGERVAVRFVLQNREEG